MRRFRFWGFGLSLFLASCGNFIEDTQGAGTSSGADELSSEDAVLDPDDLDGGLNDTIVMEPVFGYRFSIRGDFDGDGKIESLTEHYISGIDRNEVAKFYTDISDYERFMTLVEQKQPMSFLLSDNQRIDTLHVSSAPQVLGLSFLKNEGDLNGDGADEISYVIDWADMSSINSYTVMTNVNGQWRELYSFDIRDWQLPDFPGSVAYYGDFGLDGRYFLQPDDTICLRQKKELKDFPGLVRRIRPHVIQIIYCNPAIEMDTAVIDLRAPRSED